jgi:hypothetical protein
VDDEVIETTGDRKVGKKVVCGISGGVDWLQRSCAPGCRKQLTCILSITGSSGRGSKRSADPPETFHMNAVVSTPRKVPEKLKGDRPEKKRKIISVNL